MSFLAQIIGIVGLLVIVVGMQAKEKKHLLFSQAITNTCFVIQYFLLGAVTGAIMYIVNTIRTFTFYMWDKKELKPNVLLLLFFVLLAIGFGLYTYKDIFSILPIIASIATTYGGWQKKSKVLRIGMIISSSILIIHDLYFGAYTGMLTYVVVILSTLVGLIRNDLSVSKK